MTMNLILRMLRHGLLAIQLAILLLLAPPSALAVGAPMCFPDVTIRAGTSQDVPPNIDGVVQNDFGWINAWRYVFNNGTYVHDAIIQGIKDSQNIYLSFEINHDVPAPGSPTPPALNPDDEIVIAIDPDPANPAMRRLIRIFPVNASGLLSPVVNYHTSTSGAPGSWGSLASAPAGTVVAATQSGPETNKSWQVEVKLPMAAYGIPPAGNFGMYVNLIPNKLGLAYEYPWPSGSPSMLGDDLNTPPRSQWGAALTNATTCNGVYVSENQIYTDNSPPHKINTTAGSVNRFHAIVNNTTMDGSGNYVAANNVRATFKVANFGLSGNPDFTTWKTIPPSGGTAPNNPTAAVSIPGNSSADLSMDWTLSSAERGVYVAPNDHQCILVELDSNMGACVGTQNPNAMCSPGVACGGGGACNNGICVGGTTPGQECAVPISCQGTDVCQPTLFSVRSIYRNMDFAALSKFTSKPEISARGWKVPPRKAQLVELLVTKQLDTLNRNTVRQWISGKNREAEVADNTRLSAVDGSWKNLKNLANWPAAHDANYDAFVSKLAIPSVRVAQLTYLVHGCRHTGEFIKIHSTNYEICERLGSFGYVFRHADTGKSDWKNSLAGGTGLSKVAGPVERYQLRILPEKSIRLSASFSAVRSANRPVSAPDEGPQ